MDDTYTKTRRFESKPSVGSKVNEMRIDTQRDHSVWIYSLLSFLCIGPISAKSWPASSLSLQLMKCWFITTSITYRISLRELSFWSVSRKPFLPFWWAAPLFEDASRARPFGSSSCSIWGLFILRFGSRVVILFSRVAACKRIGPVRAQERGTAYIFREGLPNSTYYILSTLPVACWKN